MRTAFVSFIAVAGLAFSAQAQDPAAVTAPAPTEPATAAPAASAPTTTAPMTSAPAPAVTPPAPEAPVTAPPPAGATASAPSAAPASADSAGAVPTLPTTGDGATVTTLLQSVCVPLVKGGNFDQLAKSAGMKKARGGAYAITLSGDRAYTATIQPQGSNRNVCEIALRYALGAEQPIITSLNIYAFLQDPELKLQRNDFMVGADNIKRITLSWEYFTDKESTGLVFVQLKGPDGAALNGKYDQATLLYSERKF